MYFMFGPTKVNLCITIFEQFLIRLNYIKECLIEAEHSDS